MKEIQIGVISLGCSKNRVDTELMLGALQHRNVSFVADPAQADVIIINTCGFIESAKQESIDTILEMAQYKKTGGLKALIVAGCLSERYREELMRELPEVDAFLGVNAYDAIAEAVDHALAGEAFSEFSAPKAEGNYLDRVLTTPSYYAYVKIAEGCNNRCSYCAIPYIRGNLQSRTMEDIEAEVRMLLKAGVREIILVAQDTTRYGMDLYGKPMLCELLERLAVLPGIVWLRVLYCYPENITDELLDVMQKHETIVKYLDIPIQHLDDTVLKRMHRRNRQDATYALVRKIRQKNPNFIIRTTLIAGFPGETEEQFAVLRQGVEDLAFDRMGVFAYSQEEGTPAAEFPDQVPEEEKEARRDTLMEIQQAISLAANERRVGKIYRVLIEGAGEQEGTYWGRSYAEAPDIDGQILIHSQRPLAEGEFVPVKIESADAYDLYGGALL
ncbi:30S ribosomal protein S12 methylthiotransferase RimO [Christensenellaceae bacterium NSJ-63]|uniref:Ribosomal protein uS12 methylthiotransferase RimO n=1 Tax=Guopingia tenuis TaxID=2763656 RepID=A0A926HRN8_9FIRM|nr:30S ribosomal protein S12 methylthiotransferase RimO [Guopingia tenuis]MBC8537602.1 30S ribosomal protein S12 methylthiotransferase RimO [Guopingia tenuis]MBS5645552.1 30S ribosomal protein S12 methylthiotransferase RimO [Clostridiales bacterium]